MYEESQVQCLTHTGAQEIETIDVTIMIRIPALYPLACVLGQVMSLLSRHFLI